MNHCNHHSHETTHHTCHSTPFTGILQGIPSVQTESKIDKTKKRYIDLSQQLIQAENTMKQLNTENVSSNDGDWTKSYQYWNKWEDIEELQQQTDDAKLKLQTMVDEANFTGHCHDHGEERKMFELPEAEKMRFCERHRILGNYLYHEGLIPKAAEQYQLALSYYEYCFPEDDEEQEKLDSVRHASLCNISKCYEHMGHRREALDTASQAVRESESARSKVTVESKAKAYFRRARAHSALDEYDAAMDDLKTVLSLVPNDAAVRHELVAVQNKKKSYESAYQQMAAAMLGEKSSQKESSDMPPQKSATLSGQPATGTEYDSSQEKLLSGLNIDIPLEPDFSSLIA